MTTKDQGLSSLLLTANCALRHYYLDGPQVWFDFEDSETAKSTESEFYLGTAMVNVQDFMAAHKQIKNIIHRLKGTAYQR